MTRNGQWRTIPPEEPVAIWQTTYGSLAMILVVFFAMLVSYSQVSGRSALQIRAALGGKVNLTARTGVPGASAALVTTGEHAAAESQFLAEAGGILRGALENANLSRDVALEKTRSGWRMVLGMNALFAEGRDTIRVSMHPFLREIRNAAAKGNLAVRVAAFGPAAGTGDPRASWATPALRAASVIEFLERDGARTPLSIRGSAASRPTAGSPADPRGDLVISVSMPGVER